MRRVPDSDSAPLIAAAGASVVIATQVGLRATRDSLFLSIFDVDSLPRMILGASAFSLIALLWASRAMARLRPGRLIPIVFALSAVLLFAEWALYFRYPGLTAIVMYLHVAALGSLLVSGFWSIINEKFDPRTAKRKIGMIAGGGTLGGLVGGLLAYGVGALEVFELSDMLPLLGLMHAACGLLAHRVRGGLERAPLAGQSSPQAGVFAGLRVIARAPYLRNMALLVMTTAVTATLLDLILKAQVEAAYQDEGLIRFFAVFYALAGLATFLIQTTASRFVLERFGLAGAVALLPLTAVLGGLALLLTRVAWVGAALVRGSEATVRNSLYRSGYELLYTPVPLNAKRAAKPLIDVGLDRLGDGLGALAASALLVLGASASLDAMLGASVLTGAAGVYLSMRLHRGYVDTLKHRLHDRAEELAIPELRKGSADSMLMRTIGSLNLSRVLGRERLPGGPGTETGPDRPSATAADDVLAAMADLRSGSGERIRSRMKQRLDPVLAGQLIELLASDEVAKESIAALRQMSDRIVGELIDALLDPETPSVIRRRIPRILAAANSPRAVEGLLSGLGDSRFEVRFQCGVALARIRDRMPRSGISRERIRAAILREFDGEQGADSEQRVRLGVEHLFRLLGLIFEKGPLQLALRGLHTDDPQLRGTALEYLESTLPSEIRERLFPLIETGNAARPRPRPERDPRTDLLMSRRSIERNLSRLRQKPLANDASNSGGDP